MRNGTLTLVALDIPESQKLTEFSPAILDQAYAFCNDLAVELCESHAGEIGVPASSESSLILTFPSALAGVRVAEQLNLRLLSAPWHPSRPLCRTAVVTSDFEWQGDSLEGPATLTLQCLLKETRPGQIVVSEATHAVVRQGGGARFLSLGVHHLDDRQRAQTLYQVLHPDLPSSFRPLPSLLELASNLPSGQSQFVGRERATNQVREGFFMSRLVVLVGFGGVGKSRLAINAANEMLEDHYHGACYVDLSGADKQETPWGLLAVALEVRESPAMPLDVAVLEKLKSSEILLLFDNADGEASLISDFLERILLACPRVQILATSRVQINTSNAHTLTVAPMDVPQQGAECNIEVLSRVESVALFVYRASLVSPNFEITVHNAGTVADLCRRLEGIPLAIELAAAKLAHSSLKQIATDLDDRFSLVRKSGRTGAQPALEMAVRWSYDCLTVPQRHLLTRLSAFTGDFLLSCATRLASFAPLTPEQVPTLVAELEKLAFVSTFDYEDETYVRILDTIREFSLGECIARGRIKAIMDRHAAIYAAYACEIRDQMYGEGQTKLCKQIDKTYRNYTAAMAWSLEAANDLVSPQIILSLYMYWSLRAKFAEGLAWSQAVLKNSKNLKGVERGRIQCIAGVMASNSGDHVAAEKHFRQAQLLAEKHSHKSLLFSVLASSGNNCHFAGNLEEACSLLRGAAELAREIGDEECVADALGNLAGALVDAERYQDAHLLLQEALGINARLRRLFGLGNIHFSLGRYFRLQGDIDAATEHLEQAAIHFRKANHDRGLASTLREYAYLSMMSKSYHSAALLLGAQERLSRELHLFVPLRRRKELDVAMRKAEAELGNHFLYEFEHGSQMTTVEVFDFLLLNTKDFREAF